MVRYAHIMADEQLTKNIAYVILVILFIGMAWFVARRAGENRAQTVSYTHLTLPTSYAV